MLLLEEKSKHIVLFLSLSIILAAALFLFHLREGSYCLGVPVISEQKANEFTPSTEVDLSGLTLSGEEAPLDLGASSLYLSQDENLLDSYTTLEGVISSTNTDQTLYLVKNDALCNLPESMETGTPLTLLVTEGDYCRTVKLYLTFLPVLNIQGSETDIVAKYGYEMAGSCTLFSGFNPGTQSSSIQTSFLQWHIRGETTAKYDKKSYKISLKDEKGENADCDFLGLGSDDDWILNPMVLDDTKLREKTVMDLWNSFAETCAWDYKMSCGEYVEVVLNGEYQGLYLLQRRVDAKYLDIDKEQDILLKGNSSDTLLGGYEIVSSPFSEEDTYQLMVEAWEGENGNQFHRENFLDVSLLINYIAGWDNIGFKNMYYFLKYDPARDGYDLYFIPWDTDMSFGFYWENGFAYNYEEQLTSNLYRIEYYTQQLYSPQIDQDFADRWRDLRESLFSEETVQTVLDYNRERILSSGAYGREQEKWGEIHLGADTQENLRSFAMERLCWLDQYYASFLVSSCTNYQT